MTPSRRLFLLTATSLALAQGAQAWSWGNGERVRGNGEVVTETRDLGGFEAVSLTGSFNVVIRQGSGTKVEVKADKNLMPYLEARVVDGSKGRTLEIANKRGYDPIGTVTPSFILELPQLRSTAIAGSGKIRVESFKTAGLDASIAGSGDILLEGVDIERLGLKVSGSGDIVANGRSLQTQVSIAGSGDVKAAGLASDEVKVSIAGSGDAAVQALKRLQVSIAGSGDVRYTGSPEINSSIAGSGSVRRLKD